MKFKKVRTCILTAALAVSTAATAACGNLTTSGGVENADLSIMVYAAGYGMKWVDESIRIFNENHEGVTVGADGDALAFDTIKTKLENGTCEYDIVLVSSAYYDQFVAGGYLEPLDDMYEMTIPGSEKKVKDVVASQMQDVYNIGGSVYGVPWQCNSPSGLIYNVEMFEKYKWELPETMDELWELCDKIDADTNGKVSPITFGGADGQGYTSWNLCQWLCEYYGYDAMMEFLEFESPDVYANQEAGRTKVYETLAKLTKGKTSSGNNIALKGSEGALAVTAQTNFVGGKAAMVICGTWFPTEMEPYTSITQFEAGFCPMPHINADKRSGDGTIDTSNVRFSADGSIMAIPKTAKNKELAKEFLTYMYTTESYTSFVASNNGLLRQVENLEADPTNFNRFTREVYDYFSADGNAKTVYLVSKSKLIETGTLATFLAYKGSFFSNITNANSYEAALKVARDGVANEMTVVRSHWNSTTKTWF